MTPRAAETGAGVVLGLSAGFHDAAAALLIDGTVVAAVEEERISRVKHDASFPARSIDSCLAIAGIGPDDVDLVAYHEKPIGVVGRHLASRLRAGPRAARALLGQTPSILRKQLSVAREIDRWFEQRDASTPPVWVAEHHTSHASAAFYPSPFPDAAILTVDGVGEWATSTLAEGRGRRIETLRELRYPDSVGLLYSAFTEYCGFRVNGGEGELMGLAALGAPTEVDRIREHLVEVHEDGSIRLDPRYFSFVRGRSTAGRRFHDLFGGPPRNPGSAPTQREADLAASIQVVVEDILLAMAGELHRLSGLPSVCLAGGVALNCVANARLLAEGPFDEVWVQPAAGDSGNALGAALWAWHEVLEHPRASPPRDQMAGAFLGPSFSDDEIERWLGEAGVAYTRMPSDDALHEAVVDRLDDGAIVGWFQGRMEFGPRALGHRSILADPRDAGAHARINATIKHRAGFRPLAPAVMVEHAAEWFDVARDLPYMTVTANVVAERRRSDLEEHGEDGGSTPARDAETTSVDPLERRAQQARSEIPAVTHVDHTARVQTVDVGRNPELHGLLDAWNRSTGCPLLLNTSFNGHDEPIVCTPADAHAAFEALGLDLLVLGRCIVEPA
jgi:carbamoyltransferase